LDKRKLEASFFKALMLLSTAIVVGSLVAVFAVVILKGAPSLSIEMLTQTPKGGYYLGKEGGILNAIIGSLYLAGGATALSFALSFVITLYLHGYAGKSRFAGFVRLSLDILWGVPSIVLGAFIFIIMLYVRARASLLWGIITIAILELPIMTRAMDEVMKMVPHKLKEASYALGSTRLETVLRVMMRQAMPGILMAILLAFGRGLGDAASVLFTAGYTDSIPSSLFDPVATLPLAIFFQLGTPIPEVQQKAYASGIILLTLVLLLSVLSRFATRKLTRFVIR
jgi:phosphate transport system permease protein